MGMKVPLLDLKSQYKTIEKEILRVTRDIFESQQFILGPKVEDLEKEIAAYSGSRYAVGVSSGTDALIVSLMAADVSAGDVVLTTPYTFFATAGSIARVGARPLFADIDPQTYNISPQSMQQVIENLSPESRSRLKAVVPVHLFGQCADMHRITEISNSLGLAVIEDAAQAIGAESAQGYRAGSMGLAGCFSFFPSKNLGAFGDGGIVTTDSAALYEKMRMLRGHGSSEKYHHPIIGGNFRLDALQAAVISVKLAYLDEWTRARQENAGRYRRLFALAGLDGLVALPVEGPGRHIYNQFVIRVRERRDELREFLAKAQIGTEVYYPVPMHLQPCFSYLGYRPGDFPHAEYAARHTLALPVYPELTDDQQSYVVEKIKTFMDARAF